MKNKFLTLLLIQIFLIISCGNESSYEDYNLKTLSDITLTANNHPHGSGKKDCFYCHVKRNIHQVDTIASGQLENAKAITRREGIRGCYQCHGPNGVNQ